MRTKVWWLTGWLLGLAATATGVETVTTASLLEEMVDLERLTRTPSVAYETVQFSSYDRRSDVPGGPRWAANADGFGREPIPGFVGVLREPDENGVGDYLICDVAGTGALVRTWSADHAFKGRVRVFLDGGVDPIYDGPAHEFFTRPYAVWAPQAGLETTVFERSFDQYDACYLPIPFAERCQIIWTGNLAEQHFYQLQVRRYLEPVEVRTFAVADLAEVADVWERVGAALERPRTDWPEPDGRERQERAELAPGERKLMLLLNGSGAVRRLTLRLEADDVTRALRQTLLYVQADDWTWPQVQAPVGDFFGAAPGVNPFDSAAMTVEPDGKMVCRFVMPYRKNLRIWLHNLADTPVTAHCAVTAGAYDWDEDRSMHFYGRWRIDHDVTGHVPGTQDLTMLLARGRGRLVGSAIMLLNPNEIPDSGGCWWGEGDEKIFIDDDELPSTFGTGTEDFFNYSWCSNRIFAHAYCGQPRADGPANRGFTSNYRWQIIDDLPFDRSIAYYMEFGPHEATDGVSYGRIAYWYGRPGLVDDSRVITRHDLVHYELRETWTPAARKAAENSVFFQAEDVLAAGGHTRIEHDPLWAEGAILQWKPQTVGETLRFDLPVAEAGRYRLALTMARTPDTGGFAAELDGQEIRFNGWEAVHFRIEHGRQLRTIYVHNLDLTAGTHTLTLKSLTAGPSQCIGLDFLWIKP